MRRCNCSKIGAVLAVLVVLFSLLVQSVEAETEQVRLDKSKGGVVRGPGVKFVEVEIAVSEQFDVGYISGLPRAPGNEPEVLEGSGRVKVQLPAGEVKALVEAGAEVDVVRRFVLIEGFAGEVGGLGGDVGTQAACQGVYFYKENETNVYIPDYDGWVYSPIVISELPPVSVVTCIDMEYYIIHGYVSDLLVDLTNQNLSIEYRLWEFEGGMNNYIFQTRTGITAFNGEPANQTWLLWAMDGVFLDDGHIESWWIKVYYDDGQPHYCSASGDNCWPDIYISRVQVGDIDNTSGCENYADFTSLSTEMEIGTGYPITVDNGDFYDDQDQCGIWVDWNQNFVLDDAGEMISVSGTPGHGPYTATITPPPGASVGDTRMRIRVRHAGSLDPCGDTDWGEVEDYTINVIAGVPQYCSASSQQCDPYIKYFRLRGIDNGPSDCNAGGYSNFTSLQTDLQLGNTYMASIVSGELGFDNEVGLWIDWNQDMDFDDPCETIQTDSGPFSSYATFIVPPDAVLGTTRLRARISYVVPPAPCGEMSTGETEDYTVNIVSGQDEYCDAGRGFFSDSYIYRFRLKAIDNTTGTDWSGYSDYTSITTQLEKDTAYPFIIDTGESGPSTAVWVDWNDDKDFDDPCESISIHYLVYNEPPYSSTTLWTGTRYEKLNIPDWVGYGPKRLRIRTGNSNPCGHEKYSGEVEDYTIIISENGTTVEESYGGGKGTDQHPFLIYTAEQLNRIGINNYQWESHFKLMADIDMSELGQDLYNIIGNEMFAFEGVFDGNCRAISNFTYQSDNKHRVGLFGRMAGNSLIKNLGLIAPDVNSPGGSAIGGFVGILESGTVSNCYVKGGRISGNKAIGAIAGGHHGTIEYCYAATSVSGSSSFGAIAGLSSGSVTYDSFWDVNEALPATTSAGGTGKTTAEMQTKSTFTDAGWDFVGELVNGPNDVWKICEGTNYPKFARQIPLVGDFVCPDGVETNDLAVLCGQWLLEELSWDVGSDGGDGLVNFLDWPVFANGWYDTTGMNDLADFTEQWMQPSAYCADIAPEPDGDGFVDGLDFARFADNWLAGVGP